MVNKTVNTYLNSSRIDINSVKLTTLSEVYKTIKSLKNIEAPGYDDVTGNVKPTNSSRKKFDVLQ